MPPPEPARALPASGVISFVPSARCALSACASRSQNRAALADYVPLPLLHTILTLPISRRVVSLPSWLLDPYSLLFDLSPPAPSAYRYDTISSLRPATLCAPGPSSSDTSLHARAQAQLSYDSARRLVSIRYTLHTYVLYRILHRQPYWITGCT